MDLNNIQSIISQIKSKYIIDQLLRFCCIEITSDYRGSSILSGILQGNKKLSSRF